MSDQEAPQLSRAEQIEAAWENAQTPVEPEVTPEALNEKPAEAPPSAAPSIREFIRAQKAPEPSPTTALEQEIAELRAALQDIRNAGAQKPEMTREEMVLAKLEALEAQEAERAQADAQAREEEEFNQRVAALRTGAIENINARATEFPGLMALEQQETVVNALFQRLEEGQDTSEDEVASEVESGLREVYEKLHAVYGAQTPSKEAPRQSEPTQTLTPGLVADDAGEPDLSTMTRQEKIDYLWNKTQSR